MTVEVTMDAASGAKKNKKNCRPEPLKGAGQGSAGQRRAQASSLPSTKQLASERGR